MDESWGVVATVREHPDLLVPFLCHHLALGAERIWVFFDDPADLAEAIARRLPRVTTIFCDARHWERMGLATRPMVQTVRQNTNFRAVVAEADVAWLAHLDADEFLWAPDGIGPELKRARCADWMSIPPLERVAPRPGDMFSGLFRGPLSMGLSQVYGDEARYLEPAGLAGHSAGKPVVPARSIWHPVTHKVMDGQGGVRPGVTASTARLLHFEGLTEAHWTLKQLRYAAFGARAPVRKARLAALLDIVEAADPVAAAKLRFRRTYDLDPAVLSHLANHGALFEPRLEIETALARFGMAEFVDLSGARLDEASQAPLDEAAQALSQQREALAKAIRARLAKD